MVVEQASGSSCGDRKLWSRRQPPSWPAIVFQVQLRERDSYPVTGSERIAIPEVAETGNDGELGGSVEIATQHPRGATWPLKPTPQRLQSLDLHPPVRGIGNIDAADLQRTRASVRQHAERALGPWDCEWL
jgi:hypothetical protein